MLKTMGKSEFGGQAYFEVIANLNFGIFILYTQRGHSLDQSILKSKKSLDLLCKTSWVSVRIIFAP